MSRICLFCDESHNDEEFIESVGNSHDCVCWFCFRDVMNVGIEDAKKKKQFHAHDEEAIQKEQRRMKRLDKGIS